MWQMIGVNWGVNLTVTEMSCYNSDKKKLITNYLSC